MQTWAVLFDVFGTLIDLPEASPYADLLAPLGLPGARVRELMDGFLTEPLPTLAEAVRSVVDGQAGVSIRPETLARAEASLSAQLRGCRLVDGALEVMQELAARGLQLGLVSNMAGPYVEPIRSLGLARLVQAEIYSFNVGWLKPDPRIFHLALTRLGVEPAETIMVGDNPLDDVEGARSAGIGAILIDPAAPSGRGTIRSLRELPGPLPALADVSTGGGLPRKPGPR